METTKTIDNVSCRLGDDIAGFLKPEACVYVASSGFSIPTPLGNYNPDWAIAFKEGSVKHMYFVAETKGSMSEMQLRKIEKAKIACATKFFATLASKDMQYHVTYKKVASYNDLMDKVNSYND